MQTVNNNFTVEALVAKYRNFVKENCPKLVEEFMPIKNEAEEQLLVTLYKRVAGKDADKDILEALSQYAADFYVDALNKEELAFMANHFSEVSAFIFTYFVDKYYGTYVSCFFKKPTQKTYEIIDTLKAETGKTIFIGGAGLCDVALHFPNSTIKGYSFITKEHPKAMWALGQIRLYAAGIKSEILPCYKDTVNKSYLADVDTIIIGASDRFSFSCTKVEGIFANTKPNCNLILFLSKEKAADNLFMGFRKKLVEKRCINSIVSFEEPDTILDADTTKKLICIRANKNTNDVVCIKNNTTGEKIKLASNMLDSTILWPSYYLTAKPQKGISLSEIVSYRDLGVEEIEDFPFKNTTFNDQKGCLEWDEKEKKIPVVVPRDMAKEYQDTNLCEANLKLAENEIFKDILGLLSKIAQPCILLYGRKDKLVAGYIKELPSEGIVAYNQLACLVPKKGIDLRYVAALLLTPEVRDQIMSICEGEVDAQIFPLIMDKIIVPDHSDLERATFLSEANYQAIEASKKKMEESLNEKKSEYINEVRMRKHDMRPHLRQLTSSERLMLYYLDNTNDIEDLIKLLKKQLFTSHNALQSLSELVEHLSNEERFGEPESVNLNDYFHNIEKNSEVNFTIKVSCEKALAQRKKEIEELKEKNKKENVPSMQGMDEKSITECSLDVYIAPVDLDRIVNNIIENARRHGGLSDGRKTDYYISIDVKIDYQRDMYQIDFSNNGKPLPKGMTKERYGLKGEKAGSNAGTGSGGYIVKSIVEHYGGDFDLFSTDGITTIRIYLPKYL